MTWTKLSDHLMDELDGLGLSRSARLLHVEALVYCNRLNTDGRLLERHLRRLTDATGDEVDELVSANVWTELEDDDGWQLDWGDQLSAEEVAQRRESARMRQRKRRQHLAGDHSECLPRYCPVTRDITRDSRPKSQRESRSPVPTRPDPSRPAPKEGGTGTGERCAECGHLEHDCRRRRHTNGHEFTLRTEPPPAAPAAARGTELGLAAGERDRPEVPVR